MTKHTEGRIMPWFMKKPLPIWLLSQNIYFKWFKLWNLKRQKKKIVKGNRWIFALVEGGWWVIITMFGEDDGWWSQYLEKIKYLGGGVQLEAFLLILQLKAIVKIETQLSIWQFRTQTWRICEWRKKYLLLSALCLALP